MHRKPFPCTNRSKRTALFTFKHLSTTYTQCDSASSHSKMLKTTANINGAIKHKSLLSVWAIAGQNVHSFVIKWWTHQFSLAFCRHGQHHRHHSHRCYRIPQNHMTYTSLHIMVIWLCTMHVTTAHAHHIKHNTQHLSRSVCISHTQSLPFRSQTTQNNNKFYHHLRQCATQTMAVLTTKNTEDDAYGCYT